MKLTGRISSAWSTLMGKPLSETRQLQEENVLLKSNLAGITLELAEARQTIDSLRSRLMNREADRTDSTTAQLETLFGDLAAPISQLRMQSQLLNAGKEVSGRSIMALAARVVDVLERNGLEPIGSTGEHIPFDPQIAQPLATGVKFNPGQPVVIRFIGYRYRGKVIRKALVEARD